MVFSLGTLQGKDELRLTKVLYATNKKEVIYVYKGGATTIECKYQLRDNQLQLSVKRNGRPIFEFKRRKSGSGLFRAGKIRTFRKFSAAEFKKLSPGIRQVLNVQEQDHQGIPPNMSGFSNSSGISNGIPSIMGAESDAFSAAGGCTQTQECSCGSTSVTVTCACGYVISCQTRTTQVCDYDDVGNPINCRDVTNCTGRCD